MTEVAFCLLQLLTAEIGTLSPFRRDAASTSAVRG